MGIFAANFKCDGKNCLETAYCSKSISSMDSAIESLQKEKGWHVTENGVCLCPDCQKVAKRAQEKKTIPIRLSEIEDALTKINETLRKMKGDMYRW